MGAHARLPTGLSALDLFPVGLLPQAGHGDDRSEYVHLDRVGAICGSPSPELPRHDADAEVGVHCRAGDEAVDYLTRHLAGWVLRTIPLVSQRAGRSHPIRRSRILYGLVEQSERWHVLAHLEQARLSFHEAACLLALDWTRMQAEDGECHGFPPLGLSSRVTGWSSNPQRPRFDTPCSVIPSPDS